MTIVSKRELAEKWNCHQSTVDRYLMEGMPFLTKGNRRNGLSTFDLEVCTEWRKSKLAHLGASDEDETMQGARLRKLQAEAGLAELELEQQKGKVIPIEDVLEEWADLFSKIKSQLLALPVKTASLVCGKESIREVQAIIDEQIRIVLIELSSKYIEQQEEDESKTNNIEEGV